MRGGASWQILQNHLFSHHFFRQITPRDSRQQQCDPQTEHLCVKCAYEQDGTPTPEHYCADLSKDCPVAVCCDIRTEETCFDAITWDPIGCARYDRGGCPCPEGEVKCGANEFSSGYCTKLCCDWSTEQTCYDENWEPAYCKKYDDGPCHQSDGLKSQNVRISHSNIGVEESDADISPRKDKVRPGTAMG